MAVGHALRSVPHSPMSFNASDGPNPWISVKSTPRTPYSAALTSNDGVLTCLVFTRGLESLPTGLVPFITQRRYQGFQLAVAVEHLGLVGVVEFQRLGQGEDMFVPVVAHQCGTDRLD